MSYCINPKCPHRQNSDEVQSCQTCGTPLLIHNRYRIVKPLREPNPNHPTEVFEVEDWDDWGMPKVLKVLKDTDNQDLVKRFQQEAHILLILNKSKKYHHNQELGIPNLDSEGYFPIDVRHKKQKLYGLVMEKIEGDNLETWVRQQGAIAQEEALAWLKQIVKTLNFLHAHNFLHRDIKPANLIRQPNGKITLIDFGVAGIEGLAETQIGSLAYAAPEQMAITGKAVPQSDFFALGRTFVYLLTGRHPWELAMNNKNDRFFWHKSIRTKLDKSLVALIDQLMHFDYHQRPQDTRKILKRLAKLTKQQSKLEKSLRLLPYFVGIIIFVAFLPFLNKNVLQRLLDINFTSQGSTSYDQGNLGQAKIYFLIALNLNRNNLLAAHTLGLICDEEKNFHCAANRYRQAIASARTRQQDKDPNNDNIIVLIQALNNLSRLKILHFEPQFSQVASHLEEGFELIALARNYSEYGEYWSQIIPEVKADLEKNRGWLALEEGRYEEAQKSLEYAIALQNPKPTPDAYCLLAKVLKETDAPQLEIKKTWIPCKELPNNYQKPEIEQWRQEIYRYLNSKGEEA
ncbi:MAG: serine/threonine protein kinase [Symploca sp. SIO1C2]|nr:serine/threonine protein kinase [Symploca sp. SIO1C2]